MRGERAEFGIDPDRLDQEWLGHSELVYQYALKLADAKKKLNEAKDTVKVVEAEVARDVRLHPSRHHVDKVTEQTVKHAVQLSAQYQDASEEEIVAQHEADVLQAACNALEHKKRALENLVQLWAMSYFAEPKAPAEDRESLRSGRRDRQFKRKGNDDGDPT